MSNWENFEHYCVDYLNREFGRYAHFINRGSSDSTVSDIEVFINNNRVFYIEAKACPAQCKQFVLLPNVGTRSFEYSHRNSTPINSEAIAIMNYMNRDFEAFKEAGTAGRDILFEGCTTVFTDWITQAYRGQGVRFIITNNNVILPIENFASCFYVTAKYRIKRSGSSDVGCRNIPVIGRYAIDNYPVTLSQLDGKLFATSNQELHDVRFIIDGVEYMFSRRDNMYEIRKLSNTFNANVIFSISLNQNFTGLSNAEFISFLR